MRSIRRLLLPALLFGALCLLFRCTVPEDPSDVDKTARLKILHNGQVLSVTLEDYLIGAVAAEMPVSFGSEALKAQAVAIRTYVLSGLRHESARVCTDSTCCLAWCDPESLHTIWGDRYEENRDAVARAVAATDGEFLVYDGAPIQAVFHASSGGLTEDSGALWDGLPYLQSVSTPETEESVPGLVTSVSVPADILAETLSLSTDAPPAQWISAIRRNDAGRVKGVLIAGKAFTGAAMRRLFGLRSTAFDLFWDGETFVFTVTGHGHGIGMSQYGARLLAEDGWNYRDILAHYYPGATLTR